MKYKFKIGDKVELFATTQYMPLRACKNFMGKMLIIVDRTNESSLGNEYELYDGALEHTIAWVNELQLKEWKL